MKKSNPVLKSDTAANWEKAVNFIPQQNEIIAYEYEDGSLRLKIGDGKRKLSELQFINASAPNVNDNTLEF